VRIRGPILEGLGNAARRPAVEGFRGVVVVSVVAYHLVRLQLTRAGGSWGTTRPDWLIWFGTTRFGVDAFFVLAGVFVTASWRSCRRRAASRWAAVRDFANRRARRILPAFWAAAAVYGAVALVQGRVDLGDLALLAATQHYLEADLPGAVDLPMWSLTTEVQFYVLAPIVAVLAPRRWGVVVLAAAIALTVWWTQWPVRIEHEIGASLLPGRLDQFVTGALVGVLASRWDRGERPLAVRLAVAPGVGWVLVAALVGLGTFHGATFQRGEDTWLEYWLHPASGLVLGGIVLRLLCGPRVRVLEAPVWRFFGLISFSLYLWHYPLLDNGFDWFGLRDPGTSLVTALVAFGVLLAAAVAVSVVSYAVIEHPLAVGRRPPPEAAGLAGLAGPVVPSLDVSGPTARTSS